MMRLQIRILGAYYVFRFMKCGVTMATYMPFLPRILAQ